MQQKLHITYSRFAQQMLQIFLRIFSEKFIGVQIIRNPNNFHRHIFQLIQSLCSRSLPCPISIVRQDDLLAILAQVLDVLRCQSCSHRGNSIFNPSPISRDHIHKAFHQINLMALLDNRLGLIQMIELVAFIENSGAATVFILGLMTI